MEQKADAELVEARERLERILSRLNTERLRRSRILEALEQLSIELARPFLQALAEQSHSSCAQAF